MMKRYMRRGDGRWMEALGRLVMSLPLSIIRELLIAVDVVELKCYLIYVVAANRERYNKMSALMKTMLDRT